MEHTGSEPLGGDKNEYKTGNSGTLGGRENPGNDGASEPKKRTRRKRSNPPTATTGTPGIPAQAENTLNSQGYLSEDDVNTILNDFPTPDTTQIPQASIPDINSASIVLTLIDGVVQLGFGADAAMNREERRMLSEPLDRMIAKLPANRVMQLTQYVDPLMLLIGLVAWGSRIARLKEQAKPQAIPAPTSPTNQPPAQPSEPVTPPDDELMAVPPGIITMERV